MRTQMETVLQQIQNNIGAALTHIDGTPFQEDSWTRAEGGFGRTRVMQHGNVFEKVGVSTSTVLGTLTKEAAKLAMGREVQFDGERTPFFATSISLVIHPHNPMAPTAHMHYRYFELGEGVGGAEGTNWTFSGSADLTPCYLFAEDVIHFHHVHKQVCDRYDESFYPRFKQACDAYFYLPHRGEHRGVGGIFLGNLSGDDGEREMLFSLTQDCAEAFALAYLPIVERRKAMPFSEEQKEWQRLRRGRYVEFNLVCDRGTAFGLKTGGRVESILMTLPLIAGWEYSYQPAPESAEAYMQEVLQTPRQWL